uniref:Probable L-cysteine desulfhydrase, chloroplastic n=1 Tax=Crassostrea virginica TaxID=6565 RepID=A0A8B8E2K4_CRAVI|nr:probable L-cysteine desulfhydrase, chloroplastic [Crassostrea virginica]
MAKTAKLAKRDFGSFHASNVQELLNLSEEEYEPPAFPDGLEIPSFTAESIEFGSKFRDDHTLLEKSCTFLNHGAFGGVLKETLEYAQKWQRYTERQPLRFFDRELLPHLAYVTRRLANFIGCHPKDLLLMNNATTAINTVVHSIPLEKGDVIYCLSVTYGAVKKLLKWRCQQKGAIYHEETISFPMAGQNYILDIVTKTLKPGTKLAVFDHIPSNTPFLLPVAELTKICQDRNIPILVDGAHALGSVNLQLDLFSPDFYVSNCHKWFCCPKGSAFMYVKEGRQSQIRPLIVSHGFDSGFNSEFIWTGLHDYSPFLAIHVMINFWDVIGKERILSYMYDLRRKACELLVNEWNTGMLVPEKLQGSMGLVQLPPSLSQTLDVVDYYAAEQIQNTLYHKFNIEVPVKAIQGKLFVRISAHLYNSIDEYSKLAKAVLDLLPNCKK